MNESTILRYDKSDMRSLLAAFPKQILDALRIGNRVSLPFSGSGIRNIVLSGLGGSAIGGDLLRSYLAEELDIPFVVNRHYFLPEFVDNNSLVVISSYSGNTEETIAAHKDATRRKAKILCISSNGETQIMAQKFKQAFLTVPRGYPPRAAVGYSFIIPFLAMVKLHLIPSREKEIQETIALLKKKSTLYSSPTIKNPALSLAQKLYGKLPIIYSSADRFDVVNLRWRGQFAENAKILAFGHVLPEMNHNELVGWKVLRRHMEEMAVILLRDKDEHERIQVRMNITKSIVGEFAGGVHEIYSEGKSRMAKMFSLMYLGDWTSYYLALLNGIDPTPVNIIDYLKHELVKA